MSGKLKIGIVGLGLIGGSIEKNLFAKGEKFEIKSVSQSQGRDFKLEDLSDCDIVFLCGPQSKIPKDLKEIARIISESSNEGTVPENERAFAGTIITDAGSTKRQISKVAKDLGLKNFIPGHPMAGTEKQGYENSFPELFQDAIWVLTEENEKLEAVVSELGAKKVIMDEETHDRAVSVISHLPLLVSLGLGSLVSRLPQVQKVMGPGIKGMLRLAKGNTEMGHEIVSLNRSNIRTSWELLKAEIDSLLEIRGESLEEEISEIKEQLTTII